MSRCGNPECQKEIPDNKKYCNEQCLTRHIELKKENLSIPSRSNTCRAPIFNYENQILRDSKGQRIELQMSRGPPVRGILVDYDPEFQKIAVLEDIGNNKQKLTFVKLNYVSALSLYGEKQK